jgi:hypothetical protein
MCWLFVTHNEAVGKVSSFAHRAVNQMKHQFDYLLVVQRGLSNCNAAIDSYDILFQPVNLVNS